MSHPDIEVIGPEGVTPRIEARWSALLAADPNLGSPFYTPGFFRAVAAHRPDLRLALLREAGEIAALMPFHARGGGRAAPIAAPICDYQGLIGELPSGWTAARLLRGMGRGCYDYDHARAADPLFRDHAFRLTRSPRIDLTEGFEAWRLERRGAGGALKTVERKMRRMERELGPLRFVAHDPSPAAWARFMDWKRAAIAAMGVGFVLDTPWARATIEEIRATQTPGFAGLFSTLHAGDRLVAAHFGMRSDRAWHWWFPAYDAEVSSHSPGLALLLHCARHADETGLTEIDLGRGEERYKREFANAARPLCEGALGGASIAGLARRLRGGLHGLAERRLPPQAADLQRRAFNRLLGAGRI